MVFLPLPDPPEMAALVSALNDQYIQMAQEDRPAKQRTQTARSYASALRSLSAYMQARNVPLPTRSVLSAWREDMLQGRLTTETGKALAVNSVNVRLAAVRALLRGAAPRLPRLEQRVLLREWAEVTDAKAVFRQDILNEEHGQSLSKTELDLYIAQIKITGLKGLRDRALIMLLAGTGLRISEAVRLTLADVFLTAHPNGLFGIRVTQRPYRKARVVVLGAHTHPVFQAVRAYLIALDQPIPEPLLPGADDSLADWDMDWTCAAQDETQDTSLPIFRSLKRGPQRQAVSTTRRLAPRSVERIVGAYTIKRRKKRLRIGPRDLRRTFARLCREAGMPWEALREQLGQGTSGIDGVAVDWFQRLPGWSFKWDEGQ